MCPPYCGNVWARPGTPCPDPSAPAAVGASCYAAMRAHAEIRAIRKAWARRPAPVEPSSIRPRPMPVRRPLAALALLPLLLLAPRPGAPTPRLKTLGRH